jgi:ABC-type multidrug transport system fused ATPase/permease subunit
VQVLVWLVSEAFLNRFWAKPVRIFLFAGMRMACQAGAVAVLYFYANALKYDKSLSLLSFDLHARESILLMWSAIVLSFVMFALSSVFQYFSRITALSLGSAYEEDSSRRAFRIISRLPDPRAPSANEMLRSGAWRKIPSDARRAGMTIRTIGYSIPQVISGFGAAVSVMIIDVRLTLMLGFLMILVLIGQYPVNVKGAINSQIFEEKVRKANRGLAALGRKFISGFPERSAFDATIEDFYSDTGYRSAIYAFKGRIKVLEESTLITEIGSAFVLATAVFIIGSRLLHGGMNWGSLLAYVISLRIALSGVVQVGRLFASVSRFYPQLFRYHELFSAERKIESISAPLIEGQQIVLSEGKNLRVEAIFEIPQRIALYTPDPINRSLFHLFNHANVIDHSGQKQSFTSKPYLFLESTEIFESTNKIEDTECYHGEDPVIFKAEALKSIQLDLRKFLLDKLLVVIVYTDPLCPPIYDESLALFWIDSQLQGMVDLSKEDFKTASNKFGSLFNAQKRKDDSEDVDEEDDDG